MSEAARTALAIVIGIAGALAGWWISQHPHVVDPRGGEEPWPLSIALFETVAAGLACGLSLRPDHYSLPIALLTALFALGLVTLASTDFFRRILPNRLTYALMVLAIVFLWAWPDRSWSAIVGGAVFAIVLAAGLIALGVLTSGGRNPGGAFGIGDMKLILLVGLLLGWPLGARALILGAALGGFVALGVMIRSGRGGTMAYGPYLAAGCLFVLLWPGWP